MQDPYSRTTDPVKVSVEARLNLRGDAEFLGVRHHHSRPPTAEVRICGIDLSLVTPEESAALASAAEVLAAQHHIAWERAGLLPTPEQVDRVAPR
ncbi:hypothetical protein [Streptosporangium sp. NPDC020145]|uniref:hypothetical protein n=1 Tax=Streptosporangium sp. NPDC020145 TaxID=3154694 RepID=UPI003421AD87